MHLCAGLTVASCMMEPFGEIGANFSLQLSSRTQFAKISNKKLSPKINVKTIKTRVHLHSYLNSPRKAEKNRFFFFTFEWAYILLSGIKRPLSRRQWLQRPVLNKLVLESNEEVFFVLFYFYIINDKGRVAQNKRVKMPSDTGKNAHPRYSAHKTL